MLKSISVCLLAIIFVCPEVLAQTTSIEKKAAAQTQQTIDSFRNKEHPAKKAEKMAEKKDSDRDKAVQRAADYWDNHMQDLSDWITRHPEVGFKEYQAVDTLTSVLKDLGFTMNVGVAGLETAFVGRFDSPAGTDGPSLGIILEYDALRQPGGEAFHGDQHSSQGPIGIAAAVGIMGYMKEKSVPGRIYVYGTPAEEMGPPSKKIMHEQGIFDDADIIIRSHSSQAYSRSRAGFGVCCLNIDMARYHFMGRPSHQRSSWYGRNALEAAVMFFTGVDQMRSTWRPEASIQATIPEGGEAPNTVPDSAVVDYYVRYPDEVYLAHIKGMMDTIARSAVQATGTKVLVENYGSYRDGISLSTLEELTFAYAKKYAPASEIDEELKRPTGFEETGVVPRDIPGVGISYASSTAANHTMQMMRDALEPIGHRGFKTGTKIMTAVLYDFLTNSDFRKLVQQEHEMLKSGFNSYIDNLKKAYSSELSIQADK